MKWDKINLLQTIKIINQEDSTQNAKTFFISNKFFSRKVFFYFIEFFMQKKLHPIGLTFKIFSFQIEIDWF